MSLPDREEVTRLIGADKPEQPDPGEGWRLIDQKTDVPEVGDQYCYADQIWETRDDPLDVFLPNIAYRRRIQPDSNEVGDSTQMTEDTPQQADESDPQICSGLEDAIARLIVWVRDYRAEKSTTFINDIEMLIASVRRPTDVPQAKVRQVREEMREGLSRKEIPFWKVMGWIQLLTPEGE